MAGTTAQATLSQGSTDFSPYVAPGGVVQDYVERLGRSIITLDGTKHKKAIRKRKLSITLRDMYHEDLITLFGNIANPAQWAYLDADAGAQTKPFYISGPTVCQRIAREGRTLCSGISFDLEEV